jgi:hypothetical protein
MPKKFRYLRFLLLTASAAIVDSASSQTNTATIATTSTGFTINIQSASENVAYEWVAPATGSLWTIGSVLIADSIAGASPEGPIALGFPYRLGRACGAFQSVTYRTTGTPTATLSYLVPLRRPF